MGGIVALLYILKSVQNLSNIQEGKCMLFCSNKNALNNTFQDTFAARIFPLLEPDYDLLVVAKLF